MSDQLKNIFLHNYHRDHNAKFIPFSGYSMPINYKKGIIKEHLQVRNYAGVFDVSHMGQILISISDLNIFNLAKYIPLDFKNLKENKSYYTFILNSKGGIIDDIILSKITYQNNPYFFIVYNCSRKLVNEKIFNSILTNYKFLNDNSLISIQGPYAEQVIKFLPETVNLSFMNLLVLNYENNLIIISRSGYTGEDGFEISIPNNLITQFINKIMRNENILLCGLGARDSLRLEAGLSLYGNELNESITPFEANLNWAIHKERLNDHNLNGQVILLNQLNKGTNKYKVGLKSLSKSILRNKMKLLDEKNIEIGEITSGSYSPSMQCSIAIGYVDRQMDYKKNIYTLIRNKIETLEIVKLPFVLHNYKKG